MTQKTFRELEHEGWLARAPAYGELFGRITGQAIDPILATFGGLHGKRLLDVACGTGELAGAAARQGAAAEGLDFAATMVEAASSRHPEVQFREGDAEALPFPAASFDAVTCSFGLLHLERPDAAVAETRRVLRSGGRYTFTVWCSPDQGCDLMRLVTQAIEQHGTPEAQIPPAPPIFRFSNSDECRRTLTAEGFVAPEARPIQLKWEVGDPSEVIELIYKSIVRTPMILEAQPQEARERIHRAIMEGASTLRHGDVIQLGFPAVLATALVP